jgi:ABC-type dipeptide/oligopeptide/nickel transport system ATPase subunit
LSILLKAENICFSVEEKQGWNLKKELKQILKGISFDVIKGSILGISGESGSGKTTLAKILTGILTPTSGKITFSSSTPNNSRTSPVRLGSAKPRQVQILFQNNGEILNPFRIIEDIITEALLINNKKINVETEREKVFKSVNFPEHLWKRRGFELSGGEMQRAALARILAVKPELLLLDEPFSAQDIESQQNLLGLFLDINKNLGITMICISHNLKLLRKLTDEVIIMYNGEIVEKGKTKELLSEPKHPYTKFLLKAENYDLTYEELR